MEELWHSWKEKKRERERNSCIESDYEREAVAKSGSRLFLTDTRWQRFAVQLLSLASLDLLSVIDSLLLNNRPSRAVWLCVSGWAEGRWWRGVQDGGLQTPLAPPPPPPLLPFLFSTLSEAPALWSWRCWIRRSGRWGNLAYLCGILLFSTIWIMMAPALLPSLFLLSTLSRKHRLSSHNLVCLSDALLPSLPCAASPLLITPINIFNFCHFSPSALFSSVSVSFFLFHVELEDSSENCNFNSYH